jgi:predicted O-linked N-acetylglucosamine transferase (SPINDLY family)
VAIGLPDLVAPDAAAYEALALRLALEADLLAAVRRRLEENQSTAPLFDIAGLTRALETSYANMIELAARGEAPAAFAAAERLTMPVAGA